jgi:hypothetical protein
LLLINQIDIKESVLRGNASLKQLEVERDNLKKQFEYLDSSKVNLNMNYI